MPAVPRGGMTVGANALRAFERARWARQVNVLQAWLATLEGVAPRGDALRVTFAGTGVPDAAAAQMRFDLTRDLQRLRAAIDGKTPSAVDPSRSYTSTQGFAGDEAVHTLDNAVVFANKACAAPSLIVCGAAVARAQRWIQRLVWELVDTGVDTALPLSFSAEAVARDLQGMKTLSKHTMTTLAAVRGLLGETPPSG
ncbi:MAG: hypothetical protein KUG77_02995 [Nannocystaceae bacterium]|nr:hypothetical protein [Nannocystaceae bacterium]